MIKVITTFTEEADFAEDAAAEIKEQLGSALQANSLGILHCHADFLGGEILRALSRVLEFPIVGSASCGMSVPGSGLSSGLSLAVLTSDEAHFTAAVSGEITAQNCAAEIAKLYAALTKDGTERPVMLMPYMPLFMPVGKSQILSELNRASGNIPAFGSVGISLKDNYDESYAAGNGEVLTDRIAAAAVFAGRAPNFYTVSLKESKLLRLRDRVTKAEGQYLISIGDQLFRDYMNSYSLPSNSLFPFKFFCSDGSILVRSLANPTAEGYGLFADDVPEGAEIAISVHTAADDFAETAGELLSLIQKDHPNTPGCLIYSCMTRMFLFGKERNKEQVLLDDHLGGKAYSLAYSGGEIFPHCFTGARFDGGRFVSQLQNVSMTACVF